MIVACRLVCSRDIREIYNIDHLTVWTNSFNNC